MEQRPAPLLSGGGAAGGSGPRAPGDSTRYPPNGQAAGNLDFGLREEVTVRSEVLLPAWPHRALHYPRTDGGHGELADRVGVMQDGNVLQQGSAGGALPVSASQGWPGSSGPPNSDRARDIEAWPGRSMVQSASRLSGSG